MSSTLRRIKDVVFRAIGIYKHLSSEAYIELARDRGCEIGEGTEFTGENKLDLTRAPLITIGDNCVLTDRVRLLLHTWDTPLLQRCFPDSETPNFLGLGEITIGDNVFIGENTIVLPGVTVGDHVIIGAGSVVASDIPSECIAVGNPCKPIMSLDEYREKRLAEEPERIATYVESCEERGIEPETEMREFLQQLDPEKDTRQL